MAAKKNKINGKLVEPSTEKGLSNHRIEAWLEDADSTKPIGTAVSNSKGEFQIDIDSKDLKKTGKGAAHRVYFKIFAGRRLYMNTENSLSWKIDQKEEVNIEMEAPEVIEQGGDRIETSQILQAASFLNESDFAGVFRDFRQRAGASLGYISDMVRNSITEMDFTPVRVKGPKMEEIVNNDVKQVKKKLKDQNIIVEEVRPYNPKINADSIQNISNFTASLESGQRVLLFEEKGKVRHFMIIKEDTVRHVDDDKLKKKEPENLEKIKQELNETKKAAEEKDQQISKLQEEIMEIKKDQSFIKNILSSDAFGQFIKNNPPAGPKKVASMRGKKKPPG